MSGIPRLADTDDLLTKLEVMAWLKLPGGTVDSMVSRRTIPYVRLAPRTVRFPRRAIAAWLEERAGVSPTAKAVR